MITVSAANKSSVQPAARLALFLPYPLGAASQAQNQKANRVYGHCAVIS
jgi:hypothetical protein